MSYDLIVFEKSKAPTFYEDFLKWVEDQTQWNEARDYDSIDDTSPALVAWFMEMITTFPPLNGDFSPNDAEINADRNLENHLTDYSIGSSLIYASFGYSAAKDADQLVHQYAKKHQVGFYNPQTGKIDSDHIICCTLSTESQNNKIAIWEKIEQQILTLGSPQRGTSNRNNAFITLAFENNGTDHEFMQCSPTYPKRKNFLSKLFGAKQSKKETVLTYTVEAGTGEKIYTKEVYPIEKVVAILRNYYTERKLPNLDSWVDSGLL